MPQDPVVPETKRFQRADLRLFADCNPVHGCHHGQDRDCQEQDGQDGPHGFSLIHFALRFRPGDRLIL